MLFCAQTGPPGANGPNNAISSWPAHSQTIPGKPRFFVRGSPRWVIAPDRALILGLDQYLPPFGQYLPPFVLFLIFGLIYPLLLFHTRTKDKPVVVFGSSFCLTRKVPVHAPYHWGTIVALPALMDAHGLGVFRLGVNPYNPTTLLFLAQWPIVWIWPPFKEEKPNRGTKNQ